MKKILGLSKEYIEVKRKESGEKTFGGDQNFFGISNASKQDKLKQNCGCGIVAFSDLLLYMGKEDNQYLLSENKSYVNQILSEEDYKRYYNTIYDFMGGIKGKVGISGIKIQRSFNRLARREKWPLRAKWGLNGKKLNFRIEEMLRQDIPVICCIPMILLKKDRNDYLQLYRFEEEKLIKATCTRAHYVTITGINVIEEDMYYEVSSWGKRFYISTKEYNYFMRKHFLGTLLGNILYIYSCEREML